MCDSYSVLKVVPLAASALPNICDKENEPNACYETAGGLLKSTKHIWTCNGSLFNVINSRTGEKIASWCFGHVIKDYSVRIVCVDEFQKVPGALPLLVIGLQSDFNNGIVCIFDINGSKVLRAISVNKEVTAVHVVSATCGPFSPFQHFDGVLSVGTGGGDVLLIDLQYQAYENVLSSHGLEIRDEVNACRLSYIPLKGIRSPSISQHRQFAFNNGEHICTHLNAHDEVTPHFILKGPKGETRISVNKVEVTVSSLCYCSKLGVLFVGYNFGAWQMWDLINLKLVYTSPIFEDNIPVAHFAVQEPSDDPRAYCYVWVVYTSTNLNPVGYPVAALYSLNYERKRIIENYGLLYQNLSSCAVRFQYELALFDEDLTNSSQQGAYCLQVQPINTIISTGGSLHENQEENISLCCITWNAWSSITNRFKTCMSLFDLNQWYKAQMPPSMQDLGECESFMTHVCLSNILQEINSDTVLNVSIDLNSLKHFVGSQRLEEHYYPSSLGFQLYVLTEFNIVYVNNHGTQRALLLHLEKGGGSLALVKPTNFYQHVIELGLLPLFTETLLNTSSTLEYQREILLSVALEQKLLGWLCQCAIEWNNGSYSATGCTLNFLLNWGWQRAEVLKKNADSFCVSLFDYSGSRLDANTHNLLSNCTRQLRNLSTLFDFIIEKCLHSELGKEHILQQKESLQMVAMHLEMLLWLINIGLLPEFPLSSYPRFDEFDRLSAPYNVEHLNKYYNERRASLQALAKEQISLNGSFLFIDNFIDQECGGSKLQEQWEDGGNGLYPPSSLQVLIRTYLMDEVNTATKHCIVFYFFLDLITTLDRVEYKSVITSLLKFPTIFHMPSSLIKITQGFWKLDHGDFMAAMELLLDPSVNSGDFRTWQHRVILKALLVQERHHLALSYLQMRHPELSEVNDICTVLSLFIANSIIDDAFYFQRKNKHNVTYEKILIHFYQECNRQGVLSYILRLSLTAEEKDILTKYLNSINHPKFKDFQKANDFGHLHTTTKENGVIRKVEKPTPLSVLVRSSQQQIKYKSTAIHAKLAVPEENIKQTPRLICAKILEADFDEDCPTPCKRFKLSSRASVTSLDLQGSAQKNSSAHLHTPVVKRKVPKHSLFSSSITPQSILKVRTAIYTPDVTSARERCKTPLNLDDIPATPTEEYVSYNDTPRKSLSRTPKPFVHFDISKSSSEASLISETSNVLFINTEAAIHVPDDKALKVNVKSSLESSDDVFYSPTVSVSSMSGFSQINEISDVPDDVSIGSEYLDKSEQVFDNSKSEQLWPKPRKSYRASLSDLPVRSSPRLRKTQNKTLDDRAITYRKANPEQALSSSKSHLECEDKTLKSLIEENFVFVEDKVQERVSFLKQQGTDNTSTDLPIHSKLSLTERTPSPCETDVKRQSDIHFDYSKTPTRISNKVLRRSSISKTPGTNTVSHIREIHILSVKSSSEIGTSLKMEFETQASQFLNKESLLHSSTLQKAECSPSHQLPSSSNLESIPSTVDSKQLSPGSKLQTTSQSEEAGNSKRLSPTISQNQEFASCETQHSKWISPTKEHPVAIKSRHSMRLSPARKLPIVASQSEEADNAFKMELLDVRRSKRLSPARELHATTLESDEIEKKMSYSKQLSPARDLSTITSQTEEEEEESTSHDTRRSKRLSPSRKLFVSALHSKQLSPTKEFSTTTSQNEETDKSISHVTELLTATSQIEDKEKSLALCGTQYSKQLPAAIELSSATLQSEEQENLLMKELDLHITRKSKRLSPAREVFIATSQSEEAEKLTSHDTLHSKRLSPARELPTATSHGEEAEKPLTQVSTTHDTLYSKQLSPALELSAVTSQSIDVENSLIRELSSHSTRNTKCLSPARELFTSTLQSEEVEKSSKHESTSHDIQHSKRLSPARELFTISSQSKDAEIPFVSHGTLSLQQLSTKTLQSKETENILIKELPSHVTRHSKRLSPARELFTTTLQTKEEEKSLIHTRHSKRLSPAREVSIVSSLSEEAGKSVSHDIRHTNESVTTTVNEEAEKSLTPELISHDIRYSKRVSPAREFSIASQSDELEHPLRKNSRRSPSRELSTATCQNDEIHTSLQKRMTAHSDRYSKRLSPAREHILPEASQHDEPQLPLHQTSYDMVLQSEKPAHDQDTELSQCPASHTKQHSPVVTQSEKIDSTNLQDEFFSKKDFSCREFSVATQIEEVGSSQPALDTKKNSILSQPSDNIQSEDQLLPQNVSGVCSSTEDIQVRTKDALVQDVSRPDSSAVHEISEHEEPANITKQSGIAEDSFLNEGMLPDSQLQMEIEFETDQEIGCENLTEKPIPITDCGEEAETIVTSILQEEYSLLEHSNVEPSTDLNKACLDTDEISMDAPSLSIASSAQFDETTNPLDATLVEEPTSNDIAETVDETVYSKNLRKISGSSSSSVNMVPVDLEMNIFEVPDDMNTLNNERLPNPLKEIDLDSNYNTNAEDEFARNLLIFPEVQDDTIDSLDEHNENIKDYSLNMREVTQIMQDNNEPEVIEILSSSDELASDASSVGAGSESDSVEEDEVSEQSSSDEMVLETIPEEPSSPDSQGLCIAEEATSQASKPEEHQELESEQDIQLKDEELCSEKISKKVYEYVPKPKQSLSNFDDTFDNSEIAQTFGRNVLDQTVEQTITTLNHSVDILDKTDLNTTVSVTTSYPANELDETSASETVAKDVKCKASTKQFVGSSEVVAASNIVEPTGANKQVLIINNAKHFISTRSQVNDLPRVTRKRTNSISSTPIVARRGDIFDDSPPVTPFASNSNRDVFDQSEFMNDTAVGSKTIVDFFDKSSIVVDDGNEENIAKLKTPLRRSRRLSSSSTHDNLSKTASKTKTETPERPTTRKRSKSIDVTPQQPSKLLVNSEEKRPLSTKKLKSVKSSDYSMSRRLTRRQAHLVQNTITSSKINATSSVLSSGSNESEPYNRGPDIDAIDPIKLLDRGAFEGTPDADEERLMQKSPSSSVSGSVVNVQTRKLRNRSASQTTTNSEISDKPKVKHDFKPKGGTSSRLTRRSKSVDESLLADSSPPKLRKVQKKLKDNSIAHRTRAKSLLDQPVRKITRQQVRLELSEIPESDEKEDNMHMKKAKQPK